MIPHDTITKIQDAIRIEEVIGDFVSLTRRGSNYMACCPFHNEKTPSFVVTPTKGFYKCFGCGESGSAVTFLMKHEGMSYVEAMKYLGAKYHIEVKEKEENPEEMAARQRTESLTLASEFAAQFYVAQLAQPEGRSVGLQYFKSRGLSEETIRKYGLGWSPSDAQALVREARAKGFKEEYLIESGVFGKSDDGRIYDRFHDRVVFPIHSVSGRVIAFSCRTLHAENKAKYVNSPTTPIYVKEKALFGIWFAKSEIARKKKCFLVEGNLDVISMHQKGLLNTVASCGTALTSGQVQLIKRFTGEDGLVTVMYDGDGAGIKAAVKAIRLILAEGLNVKLVLLPGGQDPDDFCRSHTLQEVEEFIADNEQDFVIYRAGLLSERQAQDPIHRAELINELADTIAVIPDPVKRTVYVQECAHRFGVDESLLRNRAIVAAKAQREEEAKRKWQEERRREYEESLSAISVEGSAEAPVAKPKKTAKRTDALLLAEQSLLSYVLRSGRDPMMFPENSPYYEGETPLTVFEFIDSVLYRDHLQFTDPLCRRAYDVYGKFFDEGQPQELIQRRMMEGEDRELASLVERLVIDRYDLTMTALRSTLTAEVSLLVKYVPEELLKYSLALLDARRKACVKALKDASEAEKENLLKEISALAEKRKKMQEKQQNLV